MVAPTASGGQPKGDPGAVDWMYFRVPPYFCVAGLEIVAGVVGFVVEDSAVGVGVDGADVAGVVIGFAVGAAAVDVGVDAGVADGALQPINTTVQNNMVIMITSIFFT